MASTPSVAAAPAAPATPAATADEKKAVAINVVQLDGLVLLKIIKHCKESLPTVVTGQLLGLDIGGRLEVTNCYPMPSEADDSSDAATGAYQQAMMKQLRAVNVDNNAVGWYQSAFLGGFLTQTLLDTQYSHQKEIPSSVVIVYDPYRTAKGHLQLKAYRLTDAFMALYAGGKFTHKSFAQYDLSSSDILQEIPLKVHNSHLVHGFLYELREDKSMSCDLDRLYVAPGAYLEKTLGVLSTCIDDYAAEQSKLQYHQRQVARQKTTQQQYIAKRDAEQEQRRQAGRELLPEEDLSKNPLWKPIVKPSRLETFLVSNQISHYCREVATTSTQSFNKLYVVDALHKATAEERGFPAPLAVEPAAAADRKDSKR